MKAAVMLTALWMLASAAFAMPVDDPPDGARTNEGPVRVDSTGPGAELIRERLRMQEEYEEFRAERHRAQEAASASQASPGRDGIAGWKTESLDPTTAPADVAVQREREGWESAVPIAAGAGVLLLLLLKLFRPDWLRWRHWSRPKKAAPRRDGPMTIQLRPRKERIGR